MSRSAFGGCYGVSLVAETAPPTRRGCQRYLKRRFRAQIAIHSSAGSIYNNARKRIVLVKQDNVFMYVLVDSLKCIASISALATVDMHQSGLALHSALPSLPWEKQSPVEDCFGWSLIALILRGHTLAGPGFSFGGRWSGRYPDKAFP